MTESILARRRHWFLVAILAVYAALSTGYNLANPLFESPDELLHFDFVRHLQQVRALPEVALAEPLSEYHQPPLYYGLAALVTLGIPTEDYGQYIQTNPFWGYAIGDVGRDNQKPVLAPAHW